MTERKEFTFDRVVRLVIGVVVVLALLFLIHLLKNVLLPFLVACLIAYMFEPFVQYNRRLLHLRGRVIAVFVTLFESLFLLGISFYFIGPMVPRNPLQDHDAGGMDKNGRAYPRHVVEHHFRGLVDPHGHLQLVYRDSLCDIHHD